jgi:hypothetical protein
MQRTMINRMLGAGFLFLLLFAQAHAQTDPSTALGADPLPSWNDGAAKKAIVEFVKTTTEKGSPQFVAPEARIATYDQDGTTCVEPMYTQVIYCLERVPAVVKAKPDLAKRSNRSRPGEGQVLRDDRFSTASAIHAAEFDLASNFELSHLGCLGS